MKRGADRGALQVQLCPLDGRAGGADAGFGAFQLRLAQHQRPVFGLQILVQLPVIALGDLLSPVLDLQFGDRLQQLALPLLQRDPVVGVIDAQQHLAPLDLAAGHELGGHIDHLAGNPRPQRDFARRSHRAHGLNDRAEGSGLDTGYLDQHGGFAHGRFSLYVRFGVEDDGQRDDAGDHQQGADQQRHAQADAATLSIRFSVLCRHVGAVLALRCRHWLSL